MDGNSMDFARNLVVSCSLRQMWGCAWCLPLDYLYVVEEILGFGFVIGGNRTVLGMFCVSAGKSVSQRLVLSRENLKLL